MFFWILIFDPNWPFCKGYSLCTMTEFQDSLISRRFGVFSIGFLHRATLMWLESHFSHAFLNFNFWPKLTILQRLYPLHDGRFSKSSHFSNICCFLRRFFAQNNSNVIKESFLVCFSEFQILTQTDHFANAIGFGIAFARWPISKIVSSLEYLVFSQGGFCTEQL